MEEVFKPLNNLIPEIVSLTNMVESFDYVVNHLAYERQKELYRPKCKKWVESLTREIADGSFRISREDVNEIHVKDGPKERDVQAPKIYKRIGIHAIMVVIERYTYPTLIKNTASSIKGRGMHWLHHIIEDDLKNVGQEYQFYYKNDIHHYYDSIDQNDGYADTIKFTSNNYGEDTRKLKIATDVAAGKEWVATTTANNEGTGIKDGEFTLHLATGVEYTEEDIQNLLKQAGLDYTVTLTDSKTPDGDKSFYAQKVVAEADADEIEIGKTTAGAGLGSDKLTGTGKGLTFQIGANGVEDQRVTLSVGDMSSTSIGVGGADVSTQDAANKAIDMVDRAVKTVSMQRAGLGALQNRLEYTVNNLTTTNENLTAAESQIRDTDMATEMINYTKNNILQQASQAMLAQANQQPQAILQLLQ